MNTVSWQAIWDNRKHKLGHQGPGLLASLVSSGQGTWAQWAWDSSYVNATIVPTSEGSFQNELIKYITSVHFCSHKIGKQRAVILAEETQLFILYREIAWKVPIGFHRGRLSLETRIGILHVLLLSWTHTEGYLATQDEWPKATPHTNTLLSTKIIENPELLLQSSSSYILLIKTKRWAMSMGQL